MQGDGRNCRECDGLILGQDTQGDGRNCRVPVCCVWRKWIPVDCTLEEYTVCEILILV